MGLTLQRELQKTNIVMENTEERLDAGTAQPEQVATVVQAAGDAQPVETTGNAYDGGNDLAALFARWVDNPLVAIALKDPRLCRFIGDLLAGNDAGQAASRNFPSPPPQMPACTAARFGLDEAAAQEVAALGRTVMACDWSDEAVGILLKAARHDADVRDADAAGYLRGRNAVIEARRLQAIPEFH